MIRNMITFELNYSVEKEFSYLKYVQRRIPWYRENNYNSNMPEGVDEKTPETELKKIAEENHKQNKEIFNKSKQGVRREIKDKSKDLESFLTVFDYPVSEKFFVFFTLYGPGGSYHPPNNMFVKFKEDSIAENIFRTMVHEVIHLVIEEPVIQKHNISQQEKENIVNSFFEYPELKQMFPNYKFPPNYSFPKEKIKLVKLKQKAG